MISSPTPNGSNALADALAWLSGLLTGTLASTIAIIAVASVGLLLISGRVDVRRSLQVILGCFIIFGASTIAAGIVSSMAGAASSGAEVQVNPPPVYPTASVRSSAPSSPYDPYAGAALPPRQ